MEMYKWLFTNKSGSNQELCLNSGAATGATLMAQHIQPPATFLETQVYKTHQYLRLFWKSQWLYYLLGTNRAV